MGSVFIDNTDADKSISKTGKEAEGLGTKLGNGIKTAAKWGAAIGAGAAVVGAGMFKLATSSAETTDRIDKLSQKIGMSRQFFQEMDFVASQSGMSIEGLQMGFKTLTNSIDQAASGTGKGAKSFAALGISVKDSNGNLKNQETIFNESILALQGMEEGVQKAKLANDLFGRSGSEMMPMLNGAAGSIDEMRKQAHELGLVLGDDAIDAGVAFTDTMDQLKRSFGTAVAAIGVQFMPMITKFADYIIANMPTIQAVIGTVFGVISNVIGVAVGWLSKAIDAIGDVGTSISEWAGENTELLNTIKESFMTLFDGLKEGFGTVIEWIKKFGTLFKENADIIIPAIVGMVAVIVGSMIPAWIASASAAIASAVATALAFLPVTLAIAAVGVVIAGLALIWRKWGDDITRITKTVVEAVVNWFKDMSKWVSEAAEKIANGLKATWDFIMRIFNTAINIIMGYVQVLVGILTGDFEKMKEGLLKIWTSLWDLIGGVVTKAWDFLSGAFGTLWTSVSDWFTGLKDDAMQWGKNMIQGFIDGIMGMINKVKDTVKGVMNAVGDFLGFGSPTKEGPGRNIVTWGKNMVDGFLQGVDEESLKVGGVMSHLIGDMPVANATGASPGSVTGGDRWMPQVAMPIGNASRASSNSGGSIAISQQLNDLTNAIYSLALRPQVLKVDGKTIAESSYKDISRMMMRDIKQVSRAMATDWR